MKHKKRALFQSVISLILCFSMLVGTTFAWFSDGVSSGTNMIAAGSLDIELDYLAADGTWQSVDANTEVLDKDALWEPGHTEVAYLRITNAGSLALKYALGIGILSETSSTNAAGDPFKLSDYIEFGVVESETEITYASRAAARDALSGTKLIREGYSSEFSMENNGDVRYAVLVVYMPESVDNAANYATGANPPKIELGIELVAAQEVYESDSFGADYDANAEMPAFGFPENLFGDNVSVNVTADENNKVAADVTIRGTTSDAVIPVGVRLEEGATELALTVSAMNESGANITLGENEATRSLDVHVEGVSADNTIPMEITIREAAAKGLNAGNLQLYHVENGTSVPMALVDTFTAHNQFKYDPATGDIVLYMATFSEVALVVDTENAWNGDVKTDWYNETDTIFTIANADQLAGFGQIVAGGVTFEGKTVKLICDVNMGGEGYTVGGKLQFYPIGYTSEGYKGAFSGTFDGTGHKISNIFQNTWMLAGGYDNGYYNAAMGLFGYVYGGKVCNLTIDYFKSEGEFAPTGCVAAYAANATFENIAITNSHPATYNTSVAAVVGRDGKNGLNKNEGYNLIFRNITVDSTNKVSALWGSWDVGAAGLLGYLGPDSTVLLENCNVSATIDVYNDVCGNYQYYWYRYCGMLIGTVDKTESDGSLDLSNITATNCTVNFGDRHEYYYCEFVDNSLASYTHDYQFSRVEHSMLIFDDINENGRVDTAEVSTVTGCKHDHKTKGYETKDIDGDGVVDSDVLLENNQAVRIPFYQLFGGYGWGVDGVTLEEYNLEISVDRKINTGLEESVLKFASAFPNTSVNEETGEVQTSFLYRVGNQNSVTAGTLFKEATTDEHPVSDSGVYVSITSMYNELDVRGDFTPSATGNWEDGTIKFDEDKTGPVKVTIQDYDYCTPTVLYLEVVDAENVVNAVGANGKDIVLMGDVNFDGTYLYYKNTTLYGNGFTIDITEADHSDLKDSSDTNSNKSAYCNIWMVDSVLDNVKIKGSVYPKVGMTADSDYGNAAVRTEGNCEITNSYISNCRVPLRIQGNTTIENTVVDGGRYANIELRSGELILDGVTTINTSREAFDGTEGIIGFGIVIHAEAANASINVIDEGLKQYNWVGENTHKSVLTGDTYLNQAYNLIFDSNNADNIYFNYNGDRYVNTGILCLCADIESDAVTGVDDRYKQVISSYNAWVLTYDNSKHTAFFEESVGKEDIDHAGSQGVYVPVYSGNEDQTVEFTKGESYEFDTSVLTATKFGLPLEITEVKLGDSRYSYGDKITIKEGGIYQVVYTVKDPYIFGTNGVQESTPVYHSVTITVTAIAKDAEILAPKFTFIDQNGNKYESTTVKAGDKTYVMPNVTAADPTTNSMNSINIGSASISGTTVYFPVATGYTVRSGSNFNRYYPLFNGINITDYTIAGDTTGTTYTTSGNYTSLVGSSGTKFIIPANGGQTNCGDYVKTNGQSGNAAGNSDSGWQGSGYSTSYGGTYLKSGNTNASRGADANGYERIVWVEYCFNAGNGDVYYYRIGYHCNKESAQTCVTGDTMVTLADGSQKRIDQVTYEDQLLVWDFDKGEYTYANSSIIENHGYDINDIIKLTFEDGTTIKVVNVHGFFDADLNTWVDINASNAADYIGHSFTQVDGNGYKTVKLVSAETSVEYVEAWSILTADYYNCIMEGLFSITPPATEQLAFFAIGEGMQYDGEAKQADIEKYGLYTYDEFAHLMTEEQFEAFNIAEIKIAIGKGLITYEEILALLAIYA